ncbi:YdiU family protein [Aquimarina sp. AD1]|uniref:protein adenylyltransferase SelO n=1 Tax=Aquimarina sp. (strain AD1) TaxID=1714848 RepID=UPI000E52F2FB|nr:YdiU family protein [Aquimarina sp. AD1]AXT55124.1 YdiU family protein [Aquimarina sp. AD1]RKN08498.1 YdiU family protein [Aquimarina sp. AD1]
MKFNINNTFSEELPSDPILENSRRQVRNACFSYVTPRKTSNPTILHVSDEVMQDLGLSQDDAKSEEFLQIMTGNKVMKNTKPYAMHYGGHQFGNWAGQLGDGRAINLLEVVHNSKRWAVQLKGAGETPYSRNADGLAVLRSSIREYLCSEAMYHLGVPTTRALSLSITGDQVLRDILYNGNAAYEKGAVVSRVAPSFIRFGNFEVLAAHGDHTTLKLLTDYTIKYFYPEITNTGKEAYISFFKLVSERSLKMVIDWQRVGFVHGVMNTDNMSILGATIDYGPYGWLEVYDHGWTPNTTDSQFKRYRYGTQPEIVLWNLYQLANALFPLIEEADPLENILDAYQNSYKNEYIDMMTSKIGLFTKQSEDQHIIEQLEELLQVVETDMTIFFRNLSTYKKGSYNQWMQIVSEAFYTLSDVKEDVLQRWNDWFLMYDNRLNVEVLSDEQRKEKMDTINPKYVLRNYMAQLAIDDADKGDYMLIDELYKMLKKPYSEQPEYDKWFAKRPDWARDKVGCSMLSCSS